MSDYVNKVRKNGVEHDIQDARIPEITSQDEGKVLGITGNGIEPVEGGGGSGNSPTVYEVANIENIPAEILEQLKIGDIIKYPGNGPDFFYAATVQFKFGKSFSLICDSGENIYYYHYNFNIDSNEWEMDDKYIYGLGVIQEVGNDITDLSNEDWNNIRFDNMWVRDGSGMIWYGYSWYNEDTQKEYYYFQQIKTEIMVIVRYIFDIEEDCYILDENYGDEGWMEISLTGGSGSNYGPGVLELTADDLEYENNRYTLNNSKFQKLFNMEGIESANDITVKSIWVPWDVFSEILFEHAEDNIDFYREIKANGGVLFKCKAIYPEGQYNQVLTYFETYKVGMQGGSGDIYWVSFRFEIDAYEEWEEIGVHNKIPIIDGDTDFQLYGNGMEETKIYSND